MLEVGRQTGGAFVEAGGAGSEYLSGAVQLTGQRVLANLLGLERYDALEARDRARLEDVLGDKGQRMRELTSLISQRFWFLRHGETDWNVEGRLQGQKDIPLNALGRIQAEDVGRRLAKPRCLVAAVVGSALASRTPSLNAARNCVRTSA